MLRWCGLAVLGLGGCASWPSLTAPKQADAPVVARVLWQKQANLISHLAIGVSEGVVYGLSKDKLTAFEGRNGYNLWQVALKEPATGAGAGEGLVVVGTRKGEVLALSASDGGLRWKAQLNSEATGTPVVVMGGVLIKSLDGTVSYFESATGKLLWSFVKPTPGLSLSRSSEFLLLGDQVVIGTKNGLLLSLKLPSGQLLWENTLQVPTGSNELERLTDVLHMPTANQRLVCAAVYMARVSCLERARGQLVFTREWASAAGLSMDNEQLYVSDGAMLQAWSLSAGSEIWRQNRLAKTGIGTPNRWRGYVWLADQSGKLHAISPSDGQLEGELNLGFAATDLPPQIVGDNTLVMVGNKGEIAMVVVK